MAKRNTDKLPIPKRRKSQRFNHLHTHCEYSAFDGFGKMSSFIDRAIRDGYPAIGFTDHGTMRGAFDLHNLCDGKPIKPIYGNELFLTTDMDARGLEPEEQHRAVAGLESREEKREAKYQAEVELGRRERFHLTAMAEDQTGLRNMFRLTSEGWLRGFWKRPRVTLDLLSEYNQGIICFTGCAAGAVATPIRNGDLKTAKERMDQLVDSFPGRLYVEIMAHTWSVQKTVNKWMLKFAKYYNLPVVVTQDAHYVKQGDSHMHEIFLCIMTHSVMADPERFCFHGDEYFLKTREEIERSFLEHHDYIDPDIVREGLDNTLVVAERCNAKLAIDPGKVYLPPVPVPDRFGDDEYRYLQALCKRGWEARDISGRIPGTAANLGIDVDECKRQYEERLRHELRQFRKMGFVRYMLVTYEIVKEAHRRDVLMSPGRGSAASSLVAFLLGITHLDPLWHKLIFERFLAPGRTDYPDIDLDFERQHRDDMIQWAIDKWGPDYVAQITTIGRLGAKQAINDVGRVMQVSIPETRAVSAALEEGGQFGGDRTGLIRQACRTVDKCKRYAEKYPPVVLAADKLEGHVRQVGIHAGGVVLSGVPITDLMPLEMRSSARGEVPVTAFDMDALQRFGLLKFDFLVIKTLDMVADTLRVLRQRGERLPNGKKIPRGSGIWTAMGLNRDEILRGFTTGDMEAVFQCNTTSFKGLSDGVEYEKFEDITNMIAANRPGAMRSGLAREFTSLKAKGESKVSHPILEAICGDTHGVMLVQEQFQRIFSELAGYSVKRADEMRRVVAKKKGDEALDAEHDRFVAGAMARGMSEEGAEDLIKTLRFSGSYLFNLAHSASYALTAYWQMWLKICHLEAFVYGVLRHLDDDELNVFVRWARNQGVVIRAASVQSPKSDNWTLRDDNSIVGTLSSLKYVGEKSVQEIAEKAPYSSLPDFLDRVSGKSRSARVVKALVSCEAFEDWVPNPGFILDHWDEFWDIIRRKDQVRMQKPYTPTFGEAEHLSIEEASETVVWRGQLAQLLERSHQVPGWPDRALAKAAAEFSPAAAYNPVEDLLEQAGVAVEISPLDSTIWDRDHAWIAVVVNEVVYRKRGDFHSGEELDDDRKKQIGWGRQYANVSVEDMHGNRQRVRINPDTLSTFRPVIDQGAGTPFLAHITVNAIGDFRTLTADLVASEADFKQDEVSVSAQLFLGKRMPSGNGVRFPKQLGRGTKSDVIAVPTEIEVKLDRSNKPFAIMGLLDGAGNYARAIAFATEWAQIYRKPKMGIVGRFTLNLTKPKAGFGPAWFIKRHEPA